MSWNTYNEAIAEIREQFGADYFTAQEMYRDLREDYDRPVYASDIIEEMEEAEAELEAEDVPGYAEGVTDEGETDWGYWESQYGLDDYYFDDDWMDYGEEVEFTIEYGED